MVILCTWVTGLFIGLHSQFAQNHWYSVILVLQNERLYTWATGLFVGLHFQYAQNHWYVILVLQNGYSVYLGHGFVRRIALSVCSKSLVCHSCFAKWVFCTSGPRVCSSDCTFSMLKIIGMSFLFCKMFYSVYLGHGFVRRIALSVRSKSLVCHSCFATCLFCVPVSRVCSSDCTLSLLKIVFHVGYGAPQVTALRKKLCQLCSSMCLYRARASVNEKNLGISRVRSSQGNQPRPARFETFLNRPYPCRDISNTS